MVFIIFVSAQVIFYGTLKIARAKQIWVVFVVFKRQNNKLFPIVFLKMPYFLLEMTFI